MKEELFAVAGFAVLFAGFYWLTTRNAAAAPIAKTSNIVPAASGPVYQNQPLNQSVLSYFYRDGM